MARAKARWRRGSCKALTVTEFVNVDPIAIGLSAFRPQSVAMAAGRVMLTRIRALARARRDFAFETTLASRSFAPRLATLRASGYCVHLAFLSLSGPDLAGARVAERVRQGGHDAPEPVVRRRFVDGPRLIATGRAGQPPTVLDADTWAYLQERQR